MRLVFFLQSFIFRQSVESFFFQFLISSTSSLTFGFSPISTFECRFQALCPFRVTSDERLARGPQFVVLFYEFLLNIFREKREV